MIAWAASVNTRRRSTTVPAMAEAGSAVAAAVTRRPAASTRIVMMETHVQKILVFLLEIVFAHTFFRKIP